MMLGPALKHLDSHSSIHDAAIGEAEQLTELLRICLERNELDKAYETACITLEHWETRTLAHADSEEHEEGLYNAILEARPDFADKVMSLIRDHDLMRRLAADIRKSLAEQEADYSVLRKFEAMIHIDLIHNHDEEAIVAQLGG